MDDLGLDPHLLEAASDVADTVWFRLGMRVPAHAGRETGAELAERVRLEIERLV